MLKGLILTGGKSTRFGTDKALYSFEGQSFLERAASLLQSAGLKPLIVTRRGVDHSLPGCTQIYDLLPEQGPLGGLYTAMATFKNTPFLVLACDMPSVHLGLLSELKLRHDPGKAATFFSNGGQIHPFPGIYEPAVWPVLQRRLKEGALSMRGFLEELPSLNCLSWVGGPAAFSNINRKEDLPV